VLDGGFLCPGEEGIFGVESPSQKLQLPTYDSQGTAQILEEK